MFYVLAHKNKRFEKIFIHSKKLVSNENVYRKYFHFFVSFAVRLQHRLEKFLGEDLKLIFRKKLLPGVIFDVLLFRIYYNHLFNCDIGFYINNRCNLCAKFFARDTKISVFLDKRLRFDRSSLPVDFHAEF